MHIEYTGKQTDMMFPTFTVSIQVSLQLRQDVGEHFKLANIHLVGDGLNGPFCIWHIKWYASGLNKNWCGQIESKTS